LASNFQVRAGGKAVKSAPGASTVHLLSDVYPSADNVVDGIDVTWMVEKSEEEVDDTPVGTFDL
jgi:hypothetical protein